MSESDISRREFLKVASLAGLAVATGSLWSQRVYSATESSGGSSFSVVHFTDIHVQPELNAERGFAQAIQAMNSHGADFALSGGDLVFDVLAANPDRCRRLWNMYVRRTKDFNMPVHQVAGNHDYFGLGNKKITPAEAGYGKAAMLEALELENTYRSFDHKGWRFIVLDSVNPNPDGGWRPLLDDQQKEWLKEQLQGSGLPKVVTLHVPVVTLRGQLTESTNPNAAGVVMNDGKEIRELFEANNVKLVLQGHVHFCEHLQFKGVHYITSGAVSGSWWKGPHMGFPEGYGLVTFQKDSFTWEYKTFGWEAKVASLYTAEERDLIARMYREREIFALV